MSGSLQVDVARLTDASAVVNQVGDEIRQTCGAMAAGMGVRPEHPLVAAALDDFDARLGPIVEAIANAVVAHGVAMRSAAQAYQALDNSIIPESAPR